jgi:diaminopimelate epimerase
VALSTDAGDVVLTCVSMGNPHAVIVVDDVDEAPVGEVGPEVECAPEFPRKTNVEFVEVVERDFVKLRVWERGVGETLACGTGACATVVACSLLGLTEREVTVELPGGELAIHWTPEGTVLMTGPATDVFSGILDIEEDDDIAE